jgi:hypothetical protein
MGGRGEPPEGVPEGVPGGDDEFRSVVFDESFVRAARIQELSARERMNAAAHPVRPRARSAAALPRQALALMLLIAMAFAAAVYLGIRHPYRETVNGGTELSMTVIPLVPGARGSAAPGTHAASATASAPSAPARASSSPASASASVSGASSPRAATASPTPAVGSDPFTGTAVQDYAVGEAGIGLPNGTRTAHFTADQVTRALGLVEQYLLDSSLLPDVLMGYSTGGVRDLLDPTEQAQFDDSMTRPRDDRRHEATGWLVRFDPRQVRLADDQVRVAGSVSFLDLGADTLQITSDHTFVYALRPAAAANAPVLLFSVRREISYRFSHGDIAGSRLQLADSVTQAGPMSCDADTSAVLQPLFPATAASASAGGSASAGALASPSTLAVDPLDRSRPAWQVCGVLTGPAL